MANAHGGEWVPSYQLVGQKAKRFGVTSIPTFSHGHNGRSRINIRFQLKNRIIDLFANDLVEMEMT